MTELEGGSLTDVDRNALVDFLGDVQSLMQWTVSYLRDEVPSRLTEHLPLREAWEEVERSQVFAQVREQILSREHDRELAEHGLSNQQLRLKLASFRHHFESVRATRYGRAPSI